VDDDACHVELLSKGSGRDATGKAARDAAGKAARDAAGKAARDAAGKAARERRRTAPIGKS
jgi:hypothetical protein